MTENEKIHELCTDLYVYVYYAISHSCMGWTGECVVLNKCDHTGLDTKELCRAAKLFRRYVKL